MKLSSMPTSVIGNPAGEGISILILPSGNYPLWGIIAAVVFAGTGLSLSFGMSVFLGIGLEIWNWSETVVTTFSIIGKIVSLVLSFVTTWLILRYLNQTPEETFAEPPPIFEQKSD